MKTDTVAAIYDRRRRSRTAAAERAVEVLRKGETVALPTETVYGLAADALNPNAVAKIFEAKERPRFDPLIVHLPERDWLQKIVDIPEENRRLAGRLMDHFWPGPFTMVLPKREIVPEMVTGGLNTVAIRMSAHPVFAEVIRAFGSPLAAPSANRFGRISPTTAQDVRADLDGRVLLIVDAGPTPHGIESTIVSFRGATIEILRQGPITSEQLARFAKVEIVGRTPKISAPGQLATHYAPKTSLRLIDNAQSFSPEKNQRVGLLGWNGIVKNEKFVAVRQLSDSQDLREAATNLFRYLRELDALNLDLIVAERIPEKGLGAAIMDRLSRAARPVDADVPIRESIG